MGLVNVECIFFLCSSGGFFFLFLPIKYHKKARASATVQDKQLAAGHSLIIMSIRSNPLRLSSLRLCERDGQDVNVNLGGI